MRALLLFALLSSPALAQTRWYEPTVEDEQTAWNGHDTWGGEARYVSLVSGFHTFFVGPLNVLGKSGGETGVRAGTSSIGVSVSAYFPNRALSVGFDMVRGQSVLLHDFQLPDVQLGLLVPDGEVRFIFGNGVQVFSWASGLTGLRLTVFDLLRVDLRGPVMTLWVPISFETHALSFGGVIDVGVEF